MKTLLTVAFTLIVFIGFAQSPTPAECQRFKNGKFKIEDEKTGTTIITRKGKTQIEEGVAMGVKLKLKVKWIDDCTYTLKLKKVLENPNNVDMSADYTITVQIIAVSEDSYTQRSSIPEYNFVVQTEMFVIEE